MNPQRPFRKPSRKPDPWDDEHSRSKREPEAVGGLVAGYLSQHPGWLDRARGGQVMQEWEQITDTAELHDLANHCEPIRVLSHRLTLRADSHAWATQTKYQVAAILDRIAEVVGENVVTDVDVIVGVPRRG